MDKDLLLQQLDELRTYMLAEGIVDKYFLEVESLQKVRSDYVENIIGTYFSSSTACMDELQQYLNTVPLDLKNVECLIHKLKGSSAGLGAAKVHAVARDMLNFFKAKTFHRLNSALQRFRVENANLKMYLDPYTELLRQLRFLDPPNHEASDNQEEVESIDSNYEDGSNDADDNNEDD